MSLDNVTPGNNVPESLAAPPEPEIPEPEPAQAGFLVQTFGVSVKLGQ